jgi:Cytochrome c554 and c-prime
MNHKYTWMLAALVVVAFITWFALSPEPKKIESTQAPNIESLSVPAAQVQPTTLVSARPVIERIGGYIGSESCQKCHEEYHQSWHTSYHRTMTQLVTSESAPADIVEERTVTVQGETFSFSRLNDEFFVELNDPIENGKRMKRRLVLMTGSHHMHVLWYESGFDKTPAQLQIMYIIDQQRWVPRRSAFLRPPNMEKENELGRWNAICSNCHSTHPRSRPDESRITWDTRVTEFGISCEACHGPGEAHASFHEANPNAPKLVGDSIVNPLKLPTSLRSDMCGQCHGMMFVNIENAADQETYFSQGRKFRPGDSLHQAEFLKVVRAGKEHRKSETFRKFDAHPGVTDGHFWPDGELRVTGRDYSGMIESKCFQEGELSCMSCHTMHQQDVALQSEWRDDQLSPNMRNDDACLQCHPTFKDMGTTHTHHAIESEGSRCMNCHMPHTIYGILKTSRTHTISSPSVAKTVETGRPNACNLCHLDHTLEQTASHLSQWYGHAKPTLTVDEQTTAASILHFLTGDAAQRVLQVNAFNWQPARDASGTDWMRLYILLGMDDSYDAIRLMSDRAYKSLPNVPKLNYDFLDSREARGKLLMGEFQKIMSQRRTPNKALMTDSEGYLDGARLESLMIRRDQRPVYLQE